MSVLTCDICGGVLMMNESGGFTICESCGIKHTKERLKVKVQEIKGVVEVTKGEAEKERLLVNAERFLKLNYTKKALEIYKILTNEYPNDFNTWVGLAKCYFAQLEPIYGKEELLNLNTPLFASLIDAEKKQHYYAQKLNQHLIHYGKNTKAKLMIIRQV